VITMGAGNVWKVGEELLERLGSSTSSNEDASPQLTPKAKLST